MMPLDETLNIDTPENVTFDYDIAGIASRFMAALIDTILILILQVITNLLILLVLSRLGGGDGLQNLQALGSWVVGLVGLVSFLFLWGYYIFFEMLWNGQTPGKKAIKLRVIRTDGTAITLTESIIRNLVRLVDFLPAFYGIGTVAIFINRQTRRLGDLAAGTLVVREKSQQVTLDDLAAMQAAAYAAALARPAAAAGIQPAADIQPAAGELPAADILPATEELPAADVQPAAGEQPAVGEQLAAGELPAADILPVEKPARTYPVERLNYQDIQMVESFFQRQKELVNKDALAWQLLKRLLTRMEVDAARVASLTLEENLKVILAEYRQYHLQE